MADATPVVQIVVAYGHGIYMSQWGRHVTGGETVTLPVVDAMGLISAGFAELAPQTIGDD